MIFKQTSLVNTKLKMRKGKIAAQVGHGITQYMADMNNPLHVEERLRSREWIDQGMFKTILRSTEEEMIELIDILNKDNIMCFMVRDVGKTQVEPDSFTVLTVEPLSEESHNKYFGNFKLL